MPLSDIADVEISLQTAGLTQRGFGMPLLLAVNAPGPQRVRFYAETEDVADDYAVTDPEYRAIAAMFSQEPRPPLVAVGRRALPPTQRWKVTVASVLDDTHYQMRAADDTIDVLSDGTADNDEIIAALVAAWNLLANGFTASSQGSIGSKYMEILGDAAGSWIGVELLDTTGNTGANALSLLAITQDHSDPGLAADLAAIKAENDDWYGMCSLFNSEGEVDAIATFAEANEKLFVADIQDSATVTAAAGGTDTADDLADANYFRTAAIYHPANDSFIAAAWLGKCLPYDPGSETWAFKTLATVPFATLTATHIVNLKAKNCNYYNRVAGLEMTFDGKVAADEWIDVIRFRDWDKVRRQERLVLLEANSKKIPYIDAGISMIGAEMKAQNQAGMDVGGIADDPAPTVTLPKAVDQTTQDRADRTVRGVKFNYRLAGAIHKIFVRGTVTQ